MAEDINMDEVKDTRMDIRQLRRITSELERATAKSEKSIMELEKRVTELLVSLQTLTTFVMISMADNPLAPQNILLAGAMAATMAVTIAETS
jgi:hypothetical protein